MSNFYLTNACVENACKNKLIQPFWTSADGKINNNIRLYHHIVEICDFANTVNAMNDEETIKEYVSNINTQLNSLAFWNGYKAFFRWSIRFTKTDEKMSFGVRLIPVKSDSISSEFVQRLINCETVGAFKTVFSSYFTHHVSGYYASHLFKMKPEKWSGKKNQRTAVINESYFRSQLAKALFYAGLGEKWEETSQPASQRKNA